jgi:hypothetical protein
LLNRDTVVVVEQWRALVGQGEEESMGGGRNRRRWAKVSIAFEI